MILRKSILLYDTMARTIDELMAYKDELFIRQEENIRLREELQRLADVPEEPDADITEESVETEEDTEDESSLPRLTERDRALYDRVSYEIRKRDSCPCQ